MSVFDERIVSTIAGSLLVESSNNQNTGLRESLILIQLYVNKHALVHPYRTASADHRSFPKGPDTLGIMSYDWGLTAHERFRIGIDVSYP